jgi:hypothetical protein
MVIKKNLYIFASVLLLSNVAMQSMDVTVCDDGSTITRLKEYNAFVDALKNEKYEINAKSGKRSLEKLVEFAARSSDTRYLKKLMEYEAYAQFIKSKGLKIYEKYVKNDHVKNIKLLLDAGADVNAVVRVKGNETINETLLGFAVLHTGLSARPNSPNTTGFKIVKHKGDKVIELLIKRGANVEIKFSETHPTLLHYVKDEIASDFSGRKDQALLTKMKELLVNAPQIRADYLKKKAEKAERKAKTEAFIQKLENIKTDQVLNISGKDFKLHTPILLARCTALLNF